MGNVKQSCRKDTLEFAVHLLKQPSEPPLAILPAPLGEAGQVPRFPLGFSQ